MSGNTNNIIILIYVDLSKYLALFCFKTVYLWFVYEFKYILSNEITVEHKMQFHQKYDHPIILLIT